MEKTEVLIDTCFVERLTGEGEHIEDFQPIMEALSYSPVVHPYLYEHEFLRPYQKKLVADGIVSRADYEASLGPKGSYQWILYEQYFRVLYRKLKARTEAVGRKSMEDLPDNADIFTFRSSKSSLGDGHLMTFAILTGMPVILTEDEDISILQEIAKVNISTDANSLMIYNTKDLILDLAGKEECGIPRKKLKNILKATGNKDAMPEFQEKWEAANESDNEDEVRKLSKA